MTHPIASFLATVEPFKRLPPDELERLSMRSQGVKHEKGEYVFSEGDEASSVWILKSGRLEIFKFSSDGKPHAIESISPKEIYGTLCRIGGKTGSYPCTAMASTTSFSIRIPDGDFLDLFNRYPAMVTGVCLLCSQKLNVMQELTNTSQEPVQKRIIRTLLNLSKTNGNILPYTKRQIAEFAATTVETTIRFLSGFQKKKWISSSRGQIVIKDKNTLAALLNAGKNEV